MAKIIKVASTTNTPRIANQFKTSRKSTTNPFKYQNFEGNTLDISAFADVFESSAKETNKMKLIASSVARIKKKRKSNIAEPIINFVNRVCSGVSSAWNYAKNTNISFSGAIKGISDAMNTKIEIPGLKTVDEFIHKPIDFGGLKSIDNSVDGIKANIGAFGENVIDFGKDINSRWIALISKINKPSKISSDMSVAELEEMWKAEIVASSAKEVA
ncbi:MAG: hypothetical protein MJ230_02090 [bacterium]|nr:hypothetical protein [bacterium]